MSISCGFNMFLDDCLLFLLPEATFGGENCCLFVISIGFALRLGGSSGR